jgi:hypothetical protein
MKSLLPHIHTTFFFPNYTVLSFDCQNGPTPCKAEEREDCIKTIYYGRYLQAQRWKKATTFLTVDGFSVEPPSNYCFLATDTFVQIWNHLQWDAYMVLHLFQIHRFSRLSMGNTETKKLISDIKYASKGNILHPFTAILLIWQTPWFQAPILFLQELLTSRNWAW